VKKSTPLPFLAVLTCCGSIAAEPNLEELQRRLDAAKREQQKPRPQNGPKVATARQATLVVKSDSPCHLAIDGKPIADLDAGVVRTLTAAVGEALVECQSGMESEARYSLALKFESDTKVVIQIELQERILAARRKREAAAAQARAAPSGQASQAPATPPRSTPPAVASGPVASVAPASRPATTPAVRTAAASSGAASTGSVQGASAQEWANSLTQLRRDGTQTSLAKGLATLLQARGAEDTRKLEQFEGMMTRLRWHAALAMGERAGYIQYGYGYNQRREAWAQDVAMAACNSHSQRPCLIVLTDGKLNHAGFVEFADRLGAQPQAVALREFLVAAQATVKNAP
jgi:hypothetical protein